MSPIPISLLDRAAQVEGPEKRFVATALVVERRAAAPPKIVGHAAVFDQWTTLYSGTYFTWKEVVRPGAFTRALAAKQDVLALWNHDDDDILGRSVSGTLTLSEDATGLYCEITPPDTRCASDLLTLIERGDVSGMSFAFIVAPNGDRTKTTTQGERTVEERELLDLDLVDVSVVARPAYPQTDLAIRSHAHRLDRPAPPAAPAFDRDGWRCHARLRFAEAD